EVAVSIHQVGVARVVPAVLDVARLSFRVVEVAAARRALDGEPADRSRRQLAAVVADDAGAVAGPRLAGRAGPRARFVGGDEDVQHLGGADAVDDLDARRFAP